MKRFTARLLLFVFTLTLLAGCWAASESPDAAGSAGALPATYVGTAPAYHGELSVDVTLDTAGKILSIEVHDDHGEPPDIGTLAIDRIPEAIVVAQSLTVDAVTGATVTGDAIAAATADALRTAGLDPADYGYAETPAEEEYVLNLDAMPPKAPVTGSVTLTDAKGREVELGLPISTYAVSTMDVIDYIIPLLGEQAFARLVASGQDGGGGLQTYAKLYTPIVGRYMEHVGQISDHNAPFDLEMILATAPDVLIVNSAMGAHGYAFEVESQLAAAGIPIVLVDVPGKSFATSVQDTLGLLGQIFQKEDRAREVSSFIDAQFARIQSENLSERADRPTVYYEKSGYSEIFGTTSASKSGWGTVIAAAGGDNIADPILAESAAAKGGGSTLDPEYVLEAGPDFIILSGAGAGWMDNIPGSTPSVPSFNIINRTGWDRLQAVQSKQVYELAHATSRSIFGFYACLKLATVFYPEVFADVDPEAAMDEFFDRFMLTESDVTGWSYRLGGES